MYRQPEEQRPVASADGLLTPDTGPEKPGGEFTEFFGAKENTDLAPPPAQKPVEPPVPTNAPRQEMSLKRPDEKPKAGPRIVWRDKKPKEVTPKPEKPETQVKWKKGSPPGATDARAPVQPELKPPPPPSVVPKPTLQAPPPPSAPAPSQPPGQFTEIFGHALSQGSPPGPPATGGSPKSDRQVQQPIDVRGPGQVERLSANRPDLPPDGVAAERLGISGPAHLSAP